jgi:hypothetical protein
MEVLLYPDNGEKSQERRKCSFFDEIGVLNASCMYFS